MFQLFEGEFGNIEVTFFEDNYIVTNNLTNLKKLRPKEGFVWLNSTD